MRRTLVLLGASLSLVLAGGLYVISCGSSGPPSAGTKGAAAENATSRDQIFAEPRQYAQSLIEKGQQIFRFDTFGDQAFWGDQLRMHESVSKLSPKAALDLGLKVDAEALPASVVDAIKQGTVDLSDPAVTVSLVRQKAVLGVVGVFPGGADAGSSGADGSSADDKAPLTSVGFTCAICHSTVDDSVAPGIGRRVDGVANRDLDIGAIIATAPNLQPVVDLLKLGLPSIDDAQVRDVLRSWGPGKFDADLFLDGKAFQPDGRSAATLLPNANGLAGFNLHTWTGGWGTVTYWNAFVAVLELHGVGSFFDERLDNAAQFPIAAAAKLGHVSVPPDLDQVTSKLPALHVYQLALPAAKPRAGVDFDQAAAERGDKLFSGKANCNSCHHEPLWTEPGWNAHKPADLKIDSFQADRSPDHSYKTMNLAGIFVRERGLFMKPEHKGRFYHDGRFQTLLDVVTSYDTRFGLQLSDAEKADLVEYLKSL